MTAGRLRATGSAVAAPPTPEARAEVAIGVLEGRTYVPVVVPRTSPEVHGRMRLLGRSEAADVRRRARVALRDAGMVEAASSAHPELYREFTDALAVLTIAAAVRDLAADVPLADAREWEQCDDDQIGALWIRYQDLEAELDPLGRLDSLTKADIAAIEDAAKKKDAVMLISFGSWKLAAFATTSVAPPST